MELGFVNAVQSSTTGRQPRAKGSDFDIMGKFGQWANYRNVERYIPQILLACIIRISAGEKLATGNKQREKQ